VGPGEEGDGHLLDVGEDLAPQVEDQAFAQAGGLEPGQQPDAGRHQGQHGDDHGEADHGAGGVLLDDGVDGEAGQHRDGDADDGADRGQHQEAGDRRAVGPGEVEDAAEGGRAEAGRGAVVLHGAPQRHPRVHVHGGGR
jgi:hypothetical protein